MWKIAALVFTVAFVASPIVIEGRRSVIHRRREHRCFHAGHSTPHGRTDVPLFQTR